VWKKRKIDDRKMREIGDSLGDDGGIDMTGLTKDRLAQLLRPPNCLKGTQNQTRCDQRTRAVLEELHNLSPRRGNGNTGKKKRGRTNPRTIGSKFNAMPLGAPPEHTVAPP